MLGFKRKAHQPIKRVDGRIHYKQVAVTPEAHAKLREMADKARKSIIDTVDTVVGV